MKLDLKIWRQSNSESDGRLHNYEIDEITPDMSFLEMMDVLNEKLILEGVDPVARYGDQFDGSQGGSMGGFDPLAPGIERRNTYYRAKTLTLGLNVTF